MTSPAIDNEKIVDRMMEALAPLSDDFIQFKAARVLAYENAAVSESSIKRFDREAYRRELLRRKVMEGKRRAA